MWVLLIIGLLAIIALMVPFTLIGLLVIYHVARPQRAPADTSNRINKIRLIWFAMTREDWLSQKVDWLRHDEMFNVRGMK